MVLVKLVNLKKRKIDFRFIQFPPFSQKPNISPLLFWQVKKLIVFKKIDNFKYKSHNKVYYENPPPTFFSTFYPI
jgi:hypothetical protein